MRRLLVSYNNSGDRFSIIDCTLTTKVIHFGYVCLLLTGPHLECLGFLRAVVLHILTVHLYDKKVFDYCWPDFFDKACLFWYCTVKGTSQIKRLRTLTHQNDGFNWLKLQVQNIWLKFFNGCCMVFVSRKILKQFFIRVKCLYCFNINNSFALFLC